MIVKASMNSKRDLRDDIRIEALRGDVGRIPGAEVMVDPNIEAFLWFVAATMCIVILVWFLIFSGYGDPPEFVYEQF